MLKPRSRESYLWSEVRPCRHGCRTAVPEAEEVEAFTAFRPPVPLWTPFSSMGIGTSCKKTGVQLHTILPVAQCASGRKDGLPWSCVCQEALWVVRGRREAQSGLLGVSPSRGKGLTGSAQHLCHGEHGGVLRGVFV